MKAEFISVYLTPGQECSHYIGGGAGKTCNLHAEQNKAANKSTNRHLTPIVGIQGQTEDGKGFIELCSEDGKECKAG